MAHQLFNLLAIIVSILTFFYLVRLSFRSLLLRKGFLLISFGYFIGLVLHAGAEALETIGILHIELLLHIMPVFVTIGSFIIILGIYIILKDVLDPILHIKEYLENNDLDSLSRQKIFSKNNEIGLLSDTLTKTFNDLKTTTVNVKELEKRVSQRTRELHKKVVELEKFKDVTVDSILKEKEKAEKKEAKKKK